MLYLQAFLVLLVCPLNIVYKSSRYRLLSVLRSIILSPLYKVVMLDFFMADQLCSQVGSYLYIITRLETHVINKLRKILNIYILHY